MASPKRDQYKPGAGKLLKDDDTILDLTALLAKLDTITSAVTGILVNATIQTGDIEIGAVELKNASDDQRASIEAANTARTTATKVLAVQTIDETGKVNGANEANTTLQSAVSATGNGSTLDVTGKATASVLLTGTFVATVTFEGSIDDSTWVSLFACKVGDGTIATTASTTGLYRIPCAGLKSVRARVTWTSGTSITAVGRVSGLSSANEDAIYARLIEKIGGEQISRDIINVEQAAGTTRITTATTTTCLSGAGSILGILIEVATAGTVTIYDNTAGSGTIIAILPIGAVAGYYPIPRPISTGVTVVTSGADRVVVFAKA